MNNILTTTQHIKAAGTTIVWVRQAQQYQEYITAVGPTTEKLQVMVGVVKVSGHFSPIRSGHNYFLKLCLLDNLIVSVALVVLLFEEDKVTEEGLDMTLTELYAMFSP